jgi:ubiquinone/menaquinone biosynthesis C-methylase UbiE
MVYEPRKYWDKRAVNYQEYLDKVHAPGGWSIHQENFIREKIELYKPKSLLEIGFGTGRFFELYKEIPIVCGCEISPVMLMQAKSKGYNYPLILYDGLNLPYRDDSFEMILSVEVLLHVRPGDIERLIRETIRVTKRFMLIITFYSEENVSLAEHNFNHNYFKYFGDKVSVEEVKRILNQTYFFLRKL